MRSSLFLVYLGVQAVLIVAFQFLPGGGWLHTSWQILVGWLAAGFAASAALRLGERRMIWYLFAAGLFLNSSGILVEQILERFFGAPRSPNLADLFFLALYPFLIAGLAMLVYRRSGEEESGGLAAATGVSAVITIGLGLLAWEMVIAPQSVAPGVSTARLAIITAYPTGDLVLIALALRLLFTGVLGNPAFILMLLSIFCFLGADLGWAVSYRLDTAPKDSLRHLLTACSLTGFALMGAAACHPAFRELTRPSTASRRPASAVLGSLAVSMLIAPTVLALEALVDKLYGVAAR